MKKERKKIAAKIAFLMKPEITHVGGGGVIGALIVGAVLDHSRIEHGFYDEDLKDKIVLIGKNTTQVITIEELR